MSLRANYIFIDIFVDKFIDKQFIEIHVFFQLYVRLFRLFPDIFMTFDITETNKMRIMDNVWER